MKLNTDIGFFKIRFLSLILLLVFVWSITFSYRAFADTLWTHKDDAMNGEWQTLRSSASGGDLVGIFLSYTDQLSHVEYSPDRGDSWIDITPNDPDVADEDETNPDSEDRHIWSDVEISEDGVHLILSDNNPDNSHNYIWYTPNNAFVWTKMTSGGQPGNAFWNSVSLADEGQDLVAANGEDGHNIFVSTDEGDSWNDVAPYSGDWQSVSFSPNGDTLAAVDTSDSKIYVSQNQGAVWEDAEAPTRTWQKIAAANGGNMIASTSPDDDYNVYVRKDDGGAFSWVDTELAAGFDRSIDISGDGTKIATGEIPGYIYIANTDTPTVWQGQDNVGDPGIGYWHGLTIGTDVRKIAVAGYQTEVWIYEGSSDVTPPTVVSTSPEDNGKAQSDTKITINFSEPMDPDVFYTETDPCDVGHSSSCASYLDPEWSDDNTKVTLTRIRGESFKSGTTYTIGVFGEDENRNEMVEPYTWSFKANSVGSIVGYSAHALNITVVPVVNTNTEIPVLPSPALPLINRVLKLKMKGDDVKWLQGKLGGLVVDGNFGPKTKAAVILFQKAHGLVGDGIVGPKTNKILSS